MSINPHIMYTVIASGATHSGDVSLRDAIFATAFVPVVTSGDWYLKGNWSTTSANFVRLLDVTAGGFYKPIIEAGSKSLPLHDIVGACPYFRFECSAAQTDNRTITIAVKL